MNPTAHHVPHVTLPPDGLRVPAYFSDDHVEVDVIDIETASGALVSGTATIAADRFSCPSEPDLYVADFEASEAWCPVADDLVEPTAAHRDDALAVLRGSSDVALGDLWEAA